MPFSNPILKTKLYLPAIPEDFVERPHLYDRLNELEPRSLALISASAGFGKSTVVSAWLKKQKKDCAWLSLTNLDE